MDCDIAKVDRPCPFCACTTIKHRDDGETGWLECDWCGATGPYSSEDAAADVTVEQAWDKRIVPTGNEFLAALGELELAVLDLNILDIVDGWGEPKHRPEIGVKLSASAGQIYRIADALREAGRLVNSDHE